MESTEIKSTRKQYISFVSLSTTNIYLVRFDVEKLLDALKISAQRQKHRVTGHNRIAALILCGVVLRCQRRHSWSTLYHPTKVVSVKLWRAHSISDYSSFGRFPITIKLITSAGKRRTNKKRAISQRHRRRSALWLCTNM